MVVIHFNYMRKFEHYLSMLPNSGSFETKIGNYVKRNKQLTQITLYTDSKWASNENNDNYEANYNNKRSMRVVGFD